MGYINLTQEEEKKFIAPQLSGYYVNELPLVYFFFALEIISIKGSLLAVERTIL
jgi:hypothetical protein